MEIHVSLSNATKEYFCKSCGQLRLSVLHTPKTCLNCGQDNIVVGLPGELDKDTLKAEFARSDSSKQ